MQNGPDDDSIGGKILTTLGSGDDDDETLRVCRGSATSLSAGEATVVWSHASYGSDPYPANYLCRWLFLPVNGCQIGLQCRRGHSCFVKDYKVGPRLRELPPAARGS